VKNERPDRTAIDDESPGRALDDQRRRDRCTRFMEIDEATSTRDLRYNLAGQSQTISLMLIHQRRERLIWIVQFSYDDSNLAVGASEI